MLQLLMVGTSKRSKATWYGGIHNCESMNPSKFCWLTAKVPHVHVGVQGGGASVSTASPGNQLCPCDLWGCKGAYDIMSV